MRRYASSFISLAVMMLALGPPVSAQSVRSNIETIVHDYLVEHPEDVQRIVKDYIGSHPEVLKDALLDLIKKRPAASSASPSASAAGPAPDHAAAIRENTAQLLLSPHQVTLGDAQGDVVMIEFFDYNCGFCKRALADMLALMKDDTRLKIVLKEFPILGPGSLEAAQIAVAVRMQDASGSKYLAFHQKLLGEAGPVNKARALAAAAAAGLDMERIARDITSSEVAATLDENRKLAEALSIGGTPAYVIGNAVVPGAIGAAALKEKIRLARAGQSN